MLTIYMVCKGMLCCSSEPALSYHAIPITLLAAGELWIVILMSMVWFAPPIWRFPGGLFAVNQLWLRSFKIYVKKLTLFLGNHKSVMAGSCISLFLVLLSISASESHAHLHGNRQTLDSLNSICSVYQEFFSIWQNCGRQHASSESQNRLLLERIQSVS